MLGINLQTYSQRGFTLVEAVIALLVLSVSVGSLFLVYALATPQSAQSIEQQRARLIADAYYQDVARLKYQSSEGVCVVAGPEKGEQRIAYDDVDDFHGSTDASPIVFGQPFFGVDDVYKNYSASFSVTCEDSPTEELHKLKRVAFIITAPSGQPYYFDIVRGRG